MPKKRPKREAQTHAPEAPAPTVARWMGFLERHSLAVALALILIASVRIVATYHVFNHTVDEPAHIACGMEWLDQHRYTFETQHPPLARVLAALGPYLAGARCSGGQSIQNIYHEGALILYGGNDYGRRLTLARLGILPLFWLAALVTYWWARRWFTPLTAVLAVLLVTLLPPVLAHGGLATTDMAATAFLAATTLALLVWLERPTWRWSGLLGLCGGLAVLSKFSVLLFFPAAVLAMLLWYLWGARPGLARLAGQARRLVLPLAAALLVAGLTVWAGYRFSFGMVRFAGRPLPAPELYRGIKSVADHNAQGHVSYLLGQHSQFGFWHYYPVVLAVKTPLALLTLLALGTALCLKRRRQTRYGMPLAFSLGILTSALFSNINIGVRHILAVYLGFSIVAAVAAVELLQWRWRWKWAGALLGLLLLWLAGSGALAHPDYIAYFNELGGDRPEEILADSDLDWGQDMQRLGKRLRELGAAEVTFSPFILADLPGRHGFPPVRPGQPFEPAPGWNAVSITVWKVTRLTLYQQLPRAKVWPDLWKPTERVGRGTLLYYVLPRPGAAGAKPAS